jgi:glutamine amidotransferase
MTTSKVTALIDYGMGNLHSAAKALQHANSNTKVVITADAKQILAADHVVFPGVGAMRDCMGEIRRLGLDEVVHEAAKTKPFLGICVGMQALMSHSEESGGVDCLNEFDGNVKYFGKELVDISGERLKVPHMGWNTVKQVEHPLWNNIPDESRFYFVHSYYIEAAKKHQIIGHGDYGHDFAAAIAQDNVVAVQFHPEKSAKHGLQLLKNFLEWDV